MKKVLVSSLCLTALFCFGLSNPARAQATDFSWSSTSAGTWSTSSNWTPVTGGSTTFPGGSENNDTAELTGPTVIYTGSSAPTPAAVTIGTLTYDSGTTLDDQFVTNGDTTTGFTITSLVTLNSGDEIFLDPQVAAVAGTGVSVALAPTNGMIINTGGVLEMGSQNNSGVSGASFGDNAAILIATGKTLELNGGNIDVDRGSGLANGSTVSAGGVIGAAASNNSIFDIESGTLTVGNMGATSNATAATSNDTLVINSNLTMEGGSIVAGTDPGSTTKPQVDFVGNTNAIQSGASLSSGIVYAITAGNNSVIHSFKSDATLSNLLVSEAGGSSSFTGGAGGGTTIEDQIGAFTAGGMLTLGTLTVAQTHSGAPSVGAAPGFVGDVQLTSNVTVTGGAAAFTASGNVAENAGFNPVNEIDLNGNTLDLTAGGATFTPNNNTSNFWYFSSTTGTGTIKAAAISTASAFSTQTAGNVTFQATGTTSANNLGFNTTSNVNSSIASSTFLYSGSATSSSAATLVSNRSIGSLAVTTGFLNLNQAAMTAAGNASITSSGGLQLNGAGIGTLTLGSGATFTASSATLQFTISSPSAGGFDQIIGNGGTGPGGSFSITNSTLSLAGDTINYSDSYQLLTDFSSGTISGLTITGYDTTDFVATLDNTGDLSFSAAMVPEPSTWALMISGALLLFLAGAASERFPGLNLFGKSS